MKLLTFLNSSPDAIVYLVVLLALATHKIRFRGNSNVLKLDLSK